MKAIPTTYAGVRYRSLLEARWAAWFRLVGIRAAYEPEAWPGYIPDFIVQRDMCCHTVVVEVKGALDAFDLRKIRKSGWGSDSLDEHVRYGNVLLVSSKGPAEAYHMWRASGYTEAGAVVHAACLLAFWDEPRDLARADALWLDAGNAVQWRGDR